MPQPMFWTMKEPSLDPGVAGASSRREYERRRAKREELTRERHPHIGNLLLKFQETPKQEQAWATGAGGEEALAGFLADRCPEVIVLHDRRIPRRRSNIDHLAIAASGVYVIDAKRYKGKIEVRKPFFGEPKLVIAGRDQTKLVEGLTRQVEAVRSALASVDPQAPVSGCFCFVNPARQSSGTGLPLLRTLSIEGYPLLFPRRLKKLLKGQGELGDERIQLIAQALSQYFPVA